MCVCVCVPTCKKHCILLWPSLKKNKQKRFRKFAISCFVFSFIFFSICFFFLFCIVITFQTVFTASNRFVRDSQCAFCMQEYYDNRFQAMFVKMVIPGKQTFFQQSVTVLDCECDTFLLQEMLKPV